MMEDLDDRGIKSHPYWEADPSRNPGGHGKGPGGRQDLYEWIQNEQKNQNGKSRFMLYHEMGESHA